MRKHRSVKSRPLVCKRTLRGSLRSIRRATLSEATALHECSRTPQSYASVAPQAAAAVTYRALLRCAGVCVMLVGRGQSTGRKRLGIPFAVSEYPAGTADTAARGPRHYRLLSTETSEGGVGITLHAIVQHNKKSCVRRSNEFDDAVRLVQTSDNQQIMASPLHGTEATQMQQATNSDVAWQHVVLEGKLWYARQKNETVANLKIRMVFVR